MCRRLFFDRVDRVSFNLAFLQTIEGCNFAMKGLQHRLFPANVEKFLDFFQNTQTQILLFPLNLYEILPLLSKQLQHFSYYIATVVHALP